MFALWELNVSNFQKNFIYKFKFTNSVYFLSSKYAYYVLQYKNKNSLGYGDKIVHIC